MKKIHQQLIRRYSWYAHWHTYPRQGVIHTGIIILVVALFLSRFTLGIAQQPPKVSPDTLAQMNGMHVLKEGEYALITSSSKNTNGKTVKRSFTLKSGDTVSYTFDAKTTVSLVEPKANVATYVPNNSANVTIHSITDFTGYNGPVDTAIERVLRTKDKVSVIVRMKATGRYYDAKDSTTARAAKSKAYANAKASILASVGSAGRLKQDLQIINGIAIEVSANALNGLKHNPNVQRVDLDRTATASLDTSVAEINANYVWGLTDTAGNTLTGVGRRIAIIDTGVDYTHPDLGGCLGTNCKVIGGYDFVNNDTDPMDDMGHGTHVAATAAGKGLLKGVAPDAKIVAYKVLDSSGSGYFSNIIAAVQRSVDPNNDGNPADHVDVASMSLGATCSSYSTSCGPDDDLSLAVDNATAAGVVNTIAAGNSGPTANTIGSPGVARTAITVAAACKSAQVGILSYCSGPIASFSSRGPAIVNGIDLKKPDIAAPGVMICAARWGASFSSAPTCFDNQHVRISGTSMATPHMAGVAALMKQANPSYTPAQIKDRLKSTARQLTGVTYNDEGAGEVDAKAAIPVVSKVKMTPDTWNVTTTATQKTYATSQSFSITSLDSTIVSLSPTFSLTTPGITFSPSKTTLSVAKGGTDSFTGTITVDNDTVPAGRYNGVIYLQENGVNKGAIFVSIIVSPTVTASVSSIDYGIDSPSLATWTSPIQTVTVTNLRTDIPQSITIGSNGYPSGVTFSSNAPSIVIPAGGNAIVSTMLSVNNTVVPNGQYGGAIIVGNGITTTSISTTFKKFYTVTLQAATDVDVTASLFIVSSQDLSERYMFTTTTNPYTLYVNTNQPFNIQTIYGWTNGTATAQMYETMTEDVIPSGTPVQISKANATRAIQVQGTKEDGMSYSGGYNTISEFENTSTGYFVGQTFGPTSSFVISPTSTKYQFRMLSSSDGDGNQVYTFGGVVAGGATNNVTFTNIAADLKKLIVQYDVNKPGGAILPLVETCTNDGTCGTSYSGSAKAIVAQTVYEVGSLDMPFMSFADYSATGDYLFRSGQFRVTSQTNEIWPFSGRYGQTTPITNQVLYHGLGPSIWSMQFANTASQVVIPKNWEYPPTPLRRQDYVVGSHNAIPFVINQNGSQVYSGAFPSFSASGWGFGTTYMQVPLPAGQYEFKASYPYQDQAVALTGTVRAAFNTGLSDPNPPAISRLFYYAGDTRADVYDPAVTNRMEVDLNPVGGSMGAVSLEVSADGGAYQAVPIANTSGATYAATMPALSVISKVSIHLTATDSSGNALEFTFELPKGTVKTLDITSPTVSLTAPAAGSTVTGTTQITGVTADNVAVSKVEIWVDSTLLTTVTTPSFSVSWNTATLPNGTHTVTAKAYDAAGNTASTGPISVTVSNAAGTSVALTTPANGATVTGTVPLTATASDSTGISKVEFYINASIIGTDLASPYTINWDTTKTLNGSYTLTAKAYNTAGKATISSPVSVTIANTADTLSPFTTITSPVNGALVKVNSTVPVTITATDNVGVTRVDFYVNNKITCSGSLQLTGGCSWKVPTAVGKTYQLFTRAYDAAGNGGQSATVKVTSTK